MKTSPDNETKVDAEVEQAAKEVKKAIADAKQAKPAEPVQQNPDAKKDAKDSKEAKIAELTNDLKRLQADFENYKKRVEKENVQFREYASANMVKKLLPVLDSFEIAIRNTKNHDEFVKGMELIYSQFHSILSEEGLRPIETKDKKLDPYLHEVLLSEKSDKNEDSILEELQKGYMFKGCVLRHSKVKVAKK